MRARGYTLLEMTVVLALLGLAVAMAAPAGFRMIQSWRHASAVTDVLRQLSALPATARRDGRTFRIDSQEAALEAGISLPEDWTFEMDTPLAVRANGVCSDAAGWLGTANGPVPFRVEAPFCRIHRDEAP
ncbi:pilus assembly FimT family protein [Pseudoxanthomonas suwonensis]|uniref:pilus assembly FimT family protein n=1 Tax=Pseudoxanthomonas suwonensis TaxID=314722 RepID=UPI000463E85F|nr:type II secretion system protein [Pseudoxanthomonas suwonensis]